ncbi:hypothetical protein QBC42DRAFT_276865 [Cladorrhinum samala]|uniref:Uncharacterized protein n=1 Tax=Cladorrhinum samala TaxID=585594 RepID=A0AAV9HER9_9PEZI|nr:hypothetical protein QBC42DRAFT_276865 [Cladorrhinum samala]
MVNNEVNTDNYDVESSDLPRGLQNAFEQIRDQVEAVRPSIYQGKRVADTAKDPLALVQGQINKLEHLCEKAHRQRRDKNVSLGKRFTELKIEYNKQDIELGELRAKADTHLEELSRLKATNGELERQGNSDNERNRKTVEQLKTECKNRDIELGELRAKLNTHLDELGRLKTDNSELERLRRSDERYRKTVEQMKTEYKKKEVELVEMRATLNTNLDELGRLKTANSELEQLKIIENETHRNEVEQLKTKYKKKEMELVEMRATLKTNLDELGRLKTENNELKRLKIIKNETHRNKVKQLKTESTTQCNELAQLKAQNKIHVDKIEALTEENIQLNSRVQQQENQIQDLEAGLEEQIAKNEQISRLVTLPNTPGSVTHGTAECEMRNGLEEFLSRTSSPSPAVFIKIERPDPGIADATRTTTTTTAMPSPNTGLVPALWESRTDVEKIGYLGKGTTMILEKVFQTGAQRNHDLVLGFIERLGALSCNAVMPPNGGSSYPEAFSGFKSLNLFNTSTPPLEMKSLQEEFTRLCLLIPCLDDAQDQPAAFETITELLTSLMNSDHSSPTPGLAFLEALSSVRLDTKHEHFTPLKGLLAIMICELCRSLECHFPWVPKRRWDIGTILGEAVQDEVAGSPLGRFATALSDPIGSTGIQQRLAACCGDQFCAFQQLDEYGQENEMGLLCSGGIANFIIINFSKGELTVADRSSAGMPVLVCDPPASTKWDLPVRLCGGRELRIEKAPKNAAVFWLKYAMVDG